MYVNIFVCFFFSHESKAHANDIEMHVEEEDVEECVSQCDFFYNYLYLVLFYLNISFDLRTEQFNKDVKRNGILMKLQQQE